MALEPKTQPHRRGDASATKPRDARRIGLIIGAALLIGVLALGAIHQQHPLRRQQPGARERAAAVGISLPAAALQPSDDQRILATWSRCACRVGSSSAANARIRVSSPPWA